MKARAKKIQLYLNKHHHLEKSEIRTDLLYPVGNRYALLVSLIIGTGTTDRQVNKVTPELFAAADNPLKMIRLGQKKLEKIIHSTGMARKKAANIIGMSRLVCSSMPILKKDLMRLPGVGNKIAGVYVINNPESKEYDFPVDTHVRQFAIRYNLTKNTNFDKISEDLKKIFPRECWAKLHYQMIAENRLALFSFQ